MFEDRGVITKGAVIDVKILPAVDTAALDRHETANIPHAVENTIRETLHELVEREISRTEKEERV